MTTMNLNQVTALNLRGLPAKFSALRREEFGDLRFEDWFHVVQTVLGKRRR